MHACYSLFSPVSFTMRLENDHVEQATSGVEGCSYDILVLCVKFPCFQSIVNSVVCLQVAN
jgi:hypothetical protein